MSNPSMQLSVRILDVQIETRKTAKSSYKIATVEYKDLKDGKTGSRKVMSFGASEAAFGFLVGHEVNGNEYTVTAEKINDFWNWIKVEEGTNGGSAPSTTSSGSGNSILSGTSARTGDAERQQLIVRQNALTNAIKYFEVTGNKKATINDVATIVQQFADIVFGKFDPDIDTGAKSAPKVNKNTDAVLDEDGDVEF